MGCVIDWGRRIGGGRSPIRRRTPSLAGAAHSLFVPPASASSLQPTTIARDLRTRSSHAAFPDTLREPIRSSSPAFSAARIGVEGPIAEGPSPEDQPQGITAWEIEGSSVTESLIDMPAVDSLDPEARSATEDEPASLARGLVPRLVGEVGDASGPTLLCLGAVHGNEPSGVLALHRVFTALDADPTGLVGRLVGLVGNRKALLARRRFLATDLNRYWHPDQVVRVREHQGPLEAEDEEMRDLDLQLRRIAESADGRLFAVDLHTTSGEGPGFAVLDDTLRNREFALSLPITVVVGLEEELSGTITHHLHDMGARVFGFEAGQHDDPKSVDHAEAAIWIAMEASGVLAAGSRAEVAAARDLVDELRSGLPFVVEVRHRHPVAVGDGFLMEPGYVNFQPVAKNEVLARDDQGPIRTPESGLILMPLYQSQGEDGFFIVRTLVPAWLRLSARVRRWHVERFVHWLPGVRRHESLEHAFRVDRRWARFGALELFHLLGYRRLGPRGRHLVLYRRPHDD